MELAAVRMMTAAHPGVGASPKKPSPGGRGLGEGESLCARQPTATQTLPSPSLRRRPESRTPVYPALRKGRGVDSRFHGNDVGTVGMAGMTVGPGMTVGLAAAVRADAE